MWISSPLGLDRQPRRPSRCPRRSRPRRSARAPWNRPRLWRGPPAAAALASSIPSAKISLAFGLAQPTGPAAVPGPPARAAAARAGAGAPARPPAAGRRCWRPLCSPPFTRRPTRLSTLLATLRLTASASWGMDLPYSAVSVRSMAASSWPTSTETPWVWLPLLRRYASQDAAHGLRAAAAHPDAVDLLGGDAGDLRYHAVRDARAPRSVWSGLCDCLFGHAFLLLSMLRSVIPPGV